MIIYTINNMSIAMKGLRLKPKYKDLISVAVSDKLYNIKFPNRDAKFLREGFVLSQLDGEGMRAMERQQEQASKEAHKELLLKEITKNTGANFHDLRNYSHQELRTERVENALHFDNSQDDDDVDMTHTTSSGVQAEAQTSSSGVQAEAQTSSSGVQVNVRPKTTSSGTQSSTRVEESETQTISIEKERGSQATEDRSDEIEQLRHASEIEKTLIDQHAQNIERIRQQVKAEGEASHNRKKEGYKREVLQQLQINEAEAKRRIQQAQQQTQQEAQTHFTNFTGRITEFAENHYRQENQKKDQAQKEAAEANKKAKASEKSEQNTDHKNERTPNNRAKAKQRAGASPKKSPGKLLPPFPTGEPSSGSQDKPKYDKPESEHEPKGKQGRPSNTQGPPPVKKNQKNPKHDTEKDENRTRTLEKSKKSIFSIPIS